MQDAQGKTFTTYTVTVKLTSNNPQAEITPIDYTFLASDQGVHTFLGVKLKALGPKTIAATDSKDNSVTGSQNINVT